MLFCIECGSSILDDVGESISLTLSKGNPVHYHLGCFAEIAGEDFICEIKQKSLKRYESGHPPTITTPDSLAEFAGWTEDYISKVLKQQAHTKKQVGEIIKTLFEHQLSTLLEGSCDVHESAFEMDTIEVIYRIRGAGDYYQYRQFFRMPLGAVRC